jgi:hypothetical protein
MSDHDLGPVSESLRTLIAAESRPPGAPPEARARVWSAIAGKLPPGGTPGGGAAPTPASNGAFAKLALPVVGGAIAAAIAIAIGVALDDRAPTPPSRTPPPPAEPAASSPPMPPAASVTTAPPRAPAPRAAVAAPQPQRQEAASPSSDEVIERARIALARARFEDALRLLADDEQRFPADTRRGERDLLFVRALLGSSNRAAAQHRAARLRQLDPTSPSLPAIDAALAK